VDYGTRSPSLQGKILIALRRRRAGRLAGASLTFIERFFS
jgi:hypothetical protein